MGEQVCEKYAPSNWMIHGIQMLHFNVLLYRILMSSVSNARPVLSQSESVCAIDATGCPNIKTPVSSAVRLVSPCVNYSAGANNVCDRQFVYGVVPGHGQSAAKHTQALGVTHTAQLTELQLTNPAHHNGWLSSKAKMF